MTTHDDDAPGGGELDRIARTLHTEGVAHVTPRTLMQLRARQTRPATGRARGAGTRALGWGLAGACAAVFAVAIGLRMDLPSVAGDPAPVAAAASQVDSDDVLEAYAALDEDPDFYLWLASTDVQSLAME
jgi:predicted cobalt transporter CbtA